MLVYVWLAITILVLVYAVLAVVNWFTKRDPPDHHR